MERFLQYSLQKGKKIKIIFMEHEKMLSENIQVTEILSDHILYLSAKNKTKAKLLKKADILSCAYARGDDGDTLKK